MGNLFKFLKTAFIDYRHVAAIAPSSKYVVGKILKELKTKTEIRNVVEYGPGDGVITKEILKILPPEGRLFVIEINSEFVKFLKETVKDSRLKIIEDDVFSFITEKNFFSGDKVDIIVSGIPLSYFSEEKREKLIYFSAKLLNDEGIFIVYQNSLIMLKTIRKFFQSVNWKIEFKNISGPIFIITARSPRK